MNTDGSACPEVSHPTLHAVHDLILALPGDVAMIIMRILLNTDGPACLVIRHPPPNVLDDLFLALPRQSVPQWLVHVHHMDTSDS